MKFFKKKTKKEKIKSTKNICLNLIVFSFFSLFIGSAYIFLGFHNMDLAQNMRFLEASEGLNLVDKASDGNFYNAEDGYLMGVFQMRIGLILSMMATFFFGYYLVLLCWVYETK